LQAWVDERIAALSPDARWLPDTSRGLSRLRQRGFAKSTKSVWRPLWAGSLASATVAAIIVLLLVSPKPRVLAQRCVDCSIALWHGLSATSAAAPATDIIPEAARKPARDFVLEDTNQKMIRLSSYKGHVVLLNFWATWCGGCKMEMPWFVELQNEFRDRGLNAIGVSMDEDGIRSVGPYLAKHPVNYTIVAGPEELGRIYGVEAMPETLLIDRNGKIAVKHVGLVTKAQYQNEIATLLSEKSQL
jgi:cytochrome c biogenesis protein CcmG/thiol:disulfide interchange protein DsbE